MNRRKKVVLFQRGFLCLGKPFLDETVRVEGRQPFTMNRRKKKNLLKELINGAHPREKMI